VRPKGSQLVITCSSGASLAHPVTEDTLLLVLERLAPYVPREAVWEIEEAG
jgi:hypothetical protein